MRFVIVAAALLIALSWQSSSAQTVLRAERLGIAFINAPGVPNAETRYRNGALTLAAPLVFMTPLPETSPRVFTVGWGAYDPISTAGYLVWVRVDEGEWTPWQTTTATSAIYTGEAGRLYEFSVWGVNRAGNWSTNVTLTPMAATRVE